MNEVAEEVVDDAVELKTFQVKFRQIVKVEREIIVDVEAESIEHAMFLAKEELVPLPAYEDEGWEETSLLDEPEIVGGVV